MPRVRADRPRPVALAAFLRALVAVVVTGRPRRALATSSEAEFEGVPPGEWEVVCWHEGTKEEPIVVNGKIGGYTYGPDHVSAPQKATVAAGRTSTVDFVVPAP